MSLTLYKLRMGIWPAYGDLIYQKKRIPRNVVVIKYSSVILALNAAG